MNFQQLRSVRETVRQGFNLTGVAAVLPTSQPGVSRQIRELEDELGITLFERAGKRLTGLTAPGETMLPIIERLLRDSSLPEERSRRVCDLLEELQALRYSPIQPTRADLQARAEELRILLREGLQ